MSLGNEYDWTGYFDAVEAMPPRQTLMRALTAFDGDTGFDGDAGVDGIKRPRRAIDLGAGSGTDAIELIRRGWRVLAVDASLSGLRRLEARVPLEARCLLETMEARFETMRLPVVELVNASFSIPHVAPADFQAVWDRVTRAIGPGGRFAGQLFGVNDGWARKPDGLTRSFQTRSEVEGLLQGAGLIVEELEEVERDGKTAMGESKYWHVFHIVARR